VLGTKNFTEQYVLGQLYRQALQAKGFTVKYKENIGSSELIDKALKSGQINMYPEYTGTIVQNIAHKNAPKSAQATYLAAKKFSGRGAIEGPTRDAFREAIAEGFDTYDLLRGDEPYKYDLGGKDRWLERLEATLP